MKWQVYPTRYFRSKTCHLENFYKLNRLVSYYYLIFTLIQLPHFNFRRRLINVTTEKNIFYS